jgi:hypothetical protein
LQNTDNGTWVPGIPNEGGHPESKLYQMERVQGATAESDTETVEFVAKGSAAPKDCARRTKAINIRNDCPGGGSDNTRNIR